MASTKFKIIEKYRGIEIAHVNYNNGYSQYYGVIINRELSNTALLSIKACKNVIDTHLRNQKK